MDKHFLYRKRYYYSLKERFQEKSLKYKIKLQKKLSKNKFTSKLIDSYEVYALKETKWLGEYHIDDIINLPESERYNYAEIKLKELIYFEAIEIDDFDIIENKLISKFSNKQRGLFDISDEELKKTLAKIKNSFDTISNGKLFTINFKKIKSEKSDLISFANLSYTKTNESYFILKITIYPSEKFEKIFKKIINDNYTALRVPNYLPFISILKKRRFIKHESFIENLKAHNLRLLLSDLNFQIKSNITKHINGYFHNSKYSNSLPCIEYYEVDNINVMKKDVKLQDIFETDYNNHHFALNDNKVEIYFSDNYRKNQTLIQILKEKGHGGKSNISPNDATDYSDIETYCLLDSLSFPCVFQGILNEQLNNHNKLKREIYDFGKNVNKPSFFNRFFFFLYNKKYIELKQRLSQILISIKRYESEFTNQRIALYTREFDLRTFIKFSHQNTKTNENLLQIIVKDFSFQIKDLDTKAKGTNEIFKTIEELNSYRTNLFLQLVSLIIGILAFIFTFNKIKLFIMDIINHLQNIF